MEKEKRLSPETSWLKNKSTIDIMIAKFIPQSWKKQWCKRMDFLYNYKPMRIKEVTPEDWNVRKLVWAFKDGKATFEPGGKRLDEHGYAVAAPAQAAFLRKVLEG